MVSIRVQLNRYRKRKDGTYPLVFQLIYRREKRLIYSPYHLFEKEFDETRRRVVRLRHTRGFSEEVNGYIEKTIRQLRQIVYMQENQGREYTTKDIVFRYKSNQDCSLVTTYFQYQIRILKEEGHAGTASAYQSTLNCVVRYTGEQEMVPFSNINDKWVYSFVCYLRRSGLKPNSVKFYLRILRAVYNKAVREEIEGTAELSPFRGVVLNNAKTQKKAVDESVIRKVAQINTKNDMRKELARDLFLFSFYSRGMPFVDVAFLKYENIINGYICYSRHKTGQPLKVKITRPLEELIAKYRNGGKYVLPILGDGELTPPEQYRQYKIRLRQYNKTLQTMSQTLGLPVRLSSYVPRHTWATLARESGIPVSVISEGMGHSSERITYAYLAALNPYYIDKANEKVMNKCFTGIKD